jgi:Domain of unknown function (DUF4349)/Putative zinc-finger
MMKHEIAELLPFYANGTLDPADRARVEAELSSCTDCAAELRELEALGTSLKSRADGAAPMPDHILDNALARIATPATARAATRLQTAWWGTPARYATAAALVVGFGASAFAAYHAHELATSQSTEAVRVGAPQQITRADTLVYRADDKNASKVHRSMSAGNPQGAADTTAQAAAPPAEAKQHRLAKTARIEILVRDVEGALRRAQSAVRGAGGDVTALADASPRTEGAVHGASLTVEVPASRLDGTLDTLATLGTVQNRAIDAEDVDAAIVDEEARLRNLRREETDLRKLMDKGGKVDEILTVQQNLSDVRGQIEQLDATHQHDLHRVATSTITVTLTEDRPNAVPAKPGPSARIDGAWHSGLNALADTVMSFLTTIVWCIAYAPVPLALAGAAYAATRFIRTRGATAT